MSSSKETTNLKKDTSAAASPSASASASSAASAAAPLFPVGPAGKRELRKALIRSTDPAKTISGFQQKYSLHSMMARAFGTTPSHEYRATRRNAASDGGGDSNNKSGGGSGAGSGGKTLESLDTDSVMTFLSHLGVTQHEVHKRISDTFMKQLEDEIRKSKSKESLLELLRSCWKYATTIPELRPVLWAVLKQLGEETPPAVLIALAERDTENGLLKHPDVFKPLPPLLKRLCWEADWGSRITPVVEAADGGGGDDTDNSVYLQTVQSTLLFEAVDPLVKLYCSNPLLVDAANRPFVATVRERRVLTKQRRALTSSTPTTSAAAPSASISGAVAGSVSTTIMTGGILRSATQVVGGASAAVAGAASPAATSTTLDGGGGGVLTSGKAVAQLRSLLCDTVGTASNFRPKLLYALLSILMAQHGARAQHSNRASKEETLLAGADHLDCTLVADILLSAGGPLPKAYQHLLSLAQVLDDCVQEGNISDTQLAKIQASLLKIFELDEDVVVKVGGAAPLSPSSSAKEQENLKSDETSTDNNSKPDPPSNSLVRQLNRIITAGLTAMKEADPQSLFLNPVTDAIAPGYSKIISKPMSIVTMERKVFKNRYTSVAEWEQDVKLMFKNCIDYNRGSQGQWFRGEATRQAKVFREEIFPQARRHYGAEVAKRSIGSSITGEGDTSSATVGHGGALKRKAEEGPEIATLPASTKKRKKEKDEYLPSMPALACMLLADPFVVRIVIARLLRELRRGVMDGSSLPALSRLVPSLLQLLHISRWSKQICAVRGKKYYIPDSGIQIETNKKDVSTFVPFATLRRYVPLLLRLFLEAELDRRITQGGDLHAASQTLDFQLDSVEEDCWEDNNSQMQVAVSLIQGALILICQPGTGNEASLAVTFPRFAVALQHLSHNLCQDHAFFLGLVQVLSRHKAKLSIPTRDAVVSSWHGWLKSVVVFHDDEDDDTGGRGSSVSTVAHEYLMRLLNEWASMGNKVLPRDALVRFTLDTVVAVNSTVQSSSSSSSGSTFAELWKSDAPEFAAVKEQYERMLKFLPTVQAEHWKQQVGLLQDESPPSPAAKDAAENDHDSHGEDARNDNEDTATT